MKKIKLIVLFTFILFFSCKQGDMTADFEHSAIWSAHPMATINDGRIRIYWENPLNQMLTFAPVFNPDKFEIFISEGNSSDFRKVVELKNDELYAYTVDNLQNKRPCFFYVVSSKKGYEPLYSDTIMAIPNKREGFEILQTSEGMHTIWSVSVAKEINRIAYVDGQYTGDRGAVIISNINVSEKEVVNTDSYCPSWSPTNDKLVFQAGDWWTSSQLALYDYETKTITQLTDAKDYNNYAPVFSENGEFILFHSSKNTSNALVTNIWLMHLETLESSQITDIPLFIAEKPCWIDNDRFLFFGIASGEKLQLFESSISKKEITTVFESNWNELTPSISPDKNRIAFISDRSGKNEVWIYHIDSKSFSQITGYSNTEFIGTSGRYIEWLDNSTLIFTLNGNQLVKQTVSL